MNYALRITHYALRMKYTLLYIIAALTALPAVAQQLRTGDIIAVEPDYNDTMADTITLSAPIVTPQMRAPREATEAEKEYARMLAEEREEQQQIDRNLPAVDENGQVHAYTDRFYPYIGWGAYDWSGLPSWELHKGLNVNVSSSVFANFGGHGHHGAGFTQDIALMYVTNLSKKATLAVGGYFNNMTYQGTNYTTAGISALLGYRFDEHWSAYAFVQKAFNSDSYARMGGYYGYPYYGYYSPYAYPMGRGYGNGLAARNMDRIGAGLRYEWGKDHQNFVQIQVEVDRAPSQHSFYNHQRYDYPVR